MNQTQRTDSWNSHFPFEWYLENTPSTAQSRHWETNTHTSFGDSTTQHPDVLEWMWKHLFLQYPPSVLLIHLLPHWDVLLVFVQSTSCYCCCHSCVNEWNWFFQSSLTHLHQSHNHLVSFSFSTLVSGLENNTHSFPSFLVFDLEFLCFENRQKGKGKKL